MSTDQLALDIAWNRLPVLQRTLFYSQAAIGDYKYSARATDYLGWLYCDGRALSRTDYRALFEVLGTTFGAPSSSTFALPDYRGRVAGSAGSGAGLTARAMGATIGDEAHVLTTPEMAAHSHTGTTDATTVSLTNGTSVVRALGGGADIDTAGTGGIASGNSVDTISSSAHTHTFTTSTVGASAAHNNMQPTLFGGRIFIFGGLPNTPVPI